MDKFFHRLSTGLWKSANFPGGVGARTRDYEFKVIMRARDYEFKIFCPYPHARAIMSLKFVLLTTKKRKTSPI